MTTFIIIWLAILTLAVIAITVNLHGIVLGLVQDMIDLYDEHDKKKRNE